MALMLLAKQMRWHPAAAAASNASEQQQQQLQKKRGAKAATALTVCADDVAGEERLVKLRGGRRVGREVDDRVDALAGCGEAVVIGAVELNQLLVGSQRGAEVCPCAARPGLGQVRQP